MISFETAVKIKEAGFPQEYRKTDPAMDWVYDSTGELIMMHDDNDTNWWMGQEYGLPTCDISVEDAQKALIKVPTLSDLIEACKGRIIKLWILADGRGGVQLEGEGLDDVNYFSSPDEAVADLYLKLKK